jgi:hypothetical protein
MTTAAPLLHQWAPMDEACPSAPDGPQAARRASHPPRSDAIARVSYITLLVGLAVYTELWVFFASAPRDRPRDAGCAPSVACQRVSQSVCSSSLITVHGRRRYQLSGLSFRFRPEEPTTFSPARWRSRSDGRGGWLSRSRIAPERAALLEPKPCRAPRHIATESV